jgi:hypothetical protein
LPHELQRGLAACVTAVVFEITHGVKTSPHVNLWRCSTRRAR